jgi:hypothetical protein
VIDADIDFDLYGSGSDGASLMGATMRGVEGSWARLHLDPWHAMRAGWTEPLVRPILPEVPPASARLIAASAQPAWRLPASFPVLFFDPRRGTDEMFLMERRVGTGYDLSVDSAGIAMWWAKVNEARRLFDVPAEVTDRGDATWHATDVGKTLWVVGAPLQTRGRTVFWSGREGMAAFRWYPDPIVAGGTVPPGAESGLRVSFAYGLSDYLDVEWRTGPAPFLPRIDEVTGRGERYEMVGDFGLRGSRVVRLEPAGGGPAYAAAIAAWAPDRVRWTVPPGTPWGTYFVRVYADDRFVAAGNRSPIVIRP